MNGRRRRRVCVCVCVCTLKRSVVPRCQWQSAFKTRTRCDTVPSKLTPESTDGALHVFPLRVGKYIPTGVITVGQCVYVWVCVIMSGNFRKSRPAAMIQIRAVPQFCARQLRPTG